MPGTGSKMGSASAVGARLWLAVAFRILVQCRAGFWKRLNARAGAIQPAAAAAMSDMVGNIPARPASKLKNACCMQISKREVTRADVEKLCHTRASANIFKMIDLSAQGDSRQAVELLHRLLEEDDPQSVFGMFVRQFRLLLQTREIMDEGGQAADVTRELRIFGFVSGRLMAQAQRYSPSAAGGHLPPVDGDRPCQQEQPDGSGPGARSVRRQPGKILRLFFTGFLPG